MGAERGLTTGAVGSNPVALIDESPVPQLFQCPPDGLNIFVLHSNIGIVQVNPEGNALGHFLKFFDIAQDILAAKGIEAVNAVFLNLRLTGEAKLFFYL
ncbi:hypothetical protein ES703_55210 [subsurface metagenome]